MDCVPGIPYVTETTVQESANNLPTALQASEQRIAISVKLLQAAPPPPAPNC